MSWRDSLLIADRFYEKNEFRFVAEFEMKRCDDSIWPGALMKMSCVDRDESIV